ncbi:MAG: bifunctional diaminohydroxyphosphoribosylaminopyrimidine deaminase/5-amino-6-(5-phosphoribosylamino)uracil reductase RibD [Betaproteobacteria bacterium]|nr:bifunctional diaminohydroxyphosphoribosylaminopyrimidine deaminase/5-amino-6-(5-phosphoribosylamino)uracil reductase RibD [Betaproteobacteria bacterium]
MAFNPTDHAYMARAIQLAEAGRALTTPNPFVGCVIVKNGRIIGEGCTQPGGRPHAEAEALAACRENPAGATAYVTLEPCCPHPHARGPACADLLIAAGVKRVVSALHDPFDGVNGGGHSRLIAAGITVETGLMEEAVRQQLRAFLSRVTRQKPWVSLKIAASLDGKTALNNGQSQWITSPAARRDVHRLRSEACAILTGIGTLLADDPQLTVREVPCQRQPLRILLDHQLQIPDQARLLADNNVLILTTQGDAARRAALLARGVRVLEAPIDAGTGKADLAATLTLLAQLKPHAINHLMVEAGAKLNASLLRAGVVDEIILYLAPSLLGDSAQGLFALPALTSLADKISLDITDLTRVGPDIRITASVLG